MVPPELLDMTEDTKLARFAAMEKIAKSICETHEKYYGYDLTLLSAYVQSMRRLLRSATIEEWYKKEEI